MKIILNLFFDLCHTAWLLFLRRPLYGWLEWCHVILNLAGNSFYCQSCTATSMTCKLGITFTDKSKDFFIEKFCQSSCQQGKQQWLARFAGESGFDLTKTAHCSLCYISIYIYICVNNQQPRVSDTIVNESCPFWQCSCTPVRCINTGLLIFCDVAISHN